MNRTIKITGAAAAGLVALGVGIGVAVANDGPKQPTPVHQVADISSAEPTVTATVTESASPTASVKPSASPKKVQRNAVTVDPVTTTSDETPAPTPTSDAPTPGISDQAQPIGTGTPGDDGVLRPPPPPNPIIKGSSYAPQPKGPTAPVPSPTTTDQTS